MPKDKTDIRITQEAAEIFDRLSEHNFKVRTTNGILRRIIAGEFDDMKKPSSRDTTSIPADRALARDAKVRAQELGWSRLGEFMDAVIKERLDG